MVELDRSSGIAKLMMLTWENVDFRPLFRETWLGLATIWAFLIDQWESERAPFEQSNLVAFRPRSVFRAAAIRKTLARSGFSPARIRESFVEVENELLMILVGRANRNGGFKNPIAEHCSDEGRSPQYATTEADGEQRPLMRAEAERCNSFTNPAEIRGNKHPPFPYPWLFELFRRFAMEARTNLFPNRSWRQIESDDELRLVDQEAGGDGEVIARDGLHRIQLHFSALPATQHLTLLLFYTPELVDKASLVPLAEAACSGPHGLARSEEDMVVLILEWCMRHKSEDIERNINAQVELAYVLFTTGPMNEFDEWRKGGETVQDQIKRHRCRLRQWISRALRLLRSILDAPPPPNDAK